MVQLEKDLVTTIHELRDEDSWDPITIVCSPTARDDVITQLSDVGGAVGVTVQTPTMFLRSQHTKFTPRKYLDRGEIMRRVAAILLQGDTPFNESSVAEEPETLTSLTRIVQRLLALPPESLQKHGDRGLPKTSAEIAATIRDETKDDFFTEYEVRQAAEKEVQSGKVICIGLLFADPGFTKVFADAPKATFEHEDPETTFTSYVDEEEELLAVARQIRAEASDEDVPLHRIAIGCADSNYIAMGTRILKQAGIPVVSPVAKTLADHPLGKTFLKLVSLDAEMMPRREIAAVIETGALKDSPYLPVFDRITRSGAGMYNIEDWEVDEATEQDEEDDSKRAEILNWVVNLEKELVRIWEQQSWTAMSEALNGLAKRRLKSPSKGDEAKKDKEVLALIVSRIDDLRALDAIDGFNPSQQMAYELIQDSFSRTPLSSPEGLVIFGGLETLYGRDLHTAFVIGMSSDVFPGSFQADAAVTPEQSGRSSEYYAKYVEDLWHGVQHCADRLRISYSRTSLTNPKNREPSPWLQNQTFADFQGLMMHLSGSQPDPVNKEELELVKALSRSAQNEGYARIVRSRRNAEYNEYNGKIATPLASNYFDGILSASALEDYAKSPLVFFLKRMLGCDLLEDREEVLNVNPADLGTTYHEIFEKWTQEVWLLPDSPKNYSDVDWEKAKRLLYQITEEECDFLNSGRYSESTRAMQKAEIKKTTSRWFAQQKAEARDGWIPIGAETKFGFDGHPPLEVKLHDGSVVKLRGSIDRIDLKIGEEETIVRVTDFKSGSSTRYEKKGTDPSPYGRYDKGKVEVHLQLGLYGEAVRQALTGAVDSMSPIFEKWGLDGAILVEARYSFFRDQQSSGQKVVSMPISDESQSAFVDVLQNIRDCIVSGNFPPHPIGTDNWKDEAKTRLGEESYDYLVEGLQEQGIIPLLLLEPFEEDEENE